MTERQIILASATACAAVGIWLMLPRGAGRGRRLGMLVAAASLILFAWESPRLDDVAIECVFYPLAAITVISCLASVTARNPVYTAIWFGVALLATAGLMMLQGAQFLGAATVVVYAGAILVTFLFVLMLAQPEGHAFYDRLSWQTALPKVSGAALSALCGAALIGMLVMTVSDALSGSPATTETAAVESESVESEPQDASPDTTPLNQPALMKTEAVVKPADTTGQPPGREELEHNILGEQHVARLGALLFSRHLIAVEVAGTLLLAALVGAVAIGSQGGRRSAQVGAGAAQRGPTDD